MSFARIYSIYNHIYWYSCCVQLLFGVVRQFESHQTCRLLNAAFAFSAVFLLNGNLSAQTLQIAQVRFSQEFHFFLCLAEHLIGRSILLKIRRDILELRRFFVQNTVLTVLAQFVEQRSVQFIRRHDVNAAKSLIYRSDRW